MARVRAPRRVRSRRYSPQFTYGTIAAGAAVVLFAALLAALPQAAPYGLWLAAAGGVTLACYGYDKAQARRAGPRVPEAVLQAVALAGGFWGGWAGMYLFRHKTRHLEFKLVLSFSSVAHGALWYWWLH